MKVDQTIFFDLDGTLLDISERYFRLFSDFCRENNFALPISKEEYWQKKRSRISEARYLADSGAHLAAEKWEDFQRAMIESPDYLQYDVAWPGVEDCLNLLTKESPLMLVTFRRHRNSLLEQLDSLGLTQYFAEVLSPIRAPAELKKPGADLKVRLVRDRFPDTTFSGWFVGDTETDLDCGKMLGCRSALAAYGIHAPSAAVAAKADVVFENPGELLEWRPR